MNYAIAGLFVVSVILAWWIYDTAKRQKQLRATLKWEIEQTHERITDIRNMQNARMVDSINQIRKEAGVVNCLTVVGKPKKKKVVLMVILKTGEEHTFPKSYTINTNNDAQKLAVFNKKKELVAEFIAWDNWGYFDDVEEE